MAMLFYDPSKKPEPNEWLALSEAERMALVNQYHVEHVRELAEDVRQMHSLIHVIAENQLALGADTVLQASIRLSEQGFTRHEGLHAMGIMLSEELFEILQTDSSGEYMRRYCNRLEGLACDWK